MNIKVLTTALTGLFLFVFSFQIWASGEPALSIKVAPKHFKSSPEGQVFITATLLFDKGLDFRKVFDVTITQNNLICGVIDIRKLAAGVVLITATLGEETKPTAPIVLLIRPNKDGGVMEHVTVADISGAEPTNTDNSISISLPKPTGLGSSTSAMNEFISIPGGGPHGNGAGNPSSKITVFPNPANEEVNIVTEGEVMWGMAQVVDLSGKVVKNFTISDVMSQNTNFVKINLSELNAGVYFVRFKTDKETYAKRIQVVR